LFAAAGVYLWSLFKLWIHTLFLVPFENLDMLWLLVPVWLAWFFAEFFQEKVGTSIGNAMSNAIVILWGSIDCSRQTVRLIVQHSIAGFWTIFLRFLIIAGIFAYGVLIIVLGWKGNKIIKTIGRIREITYVFVIFVPVFYNATKLSFDLFFAAVLFFPLFYFFIELINRYLPDPKAVVQDLSDKEQNSIKSGFGGSSYQPGGLSGQFGQGSGPGGNYNFKF
jgi:hypothetical protein